MTIDLPPVPEGPDRPLVLARIYPGFQEEAFELFQEDAENLAVHGYLAVAQSYADGHYSAWATTIATILIVFGIGVLILLYMAAVRPPGSLAVTYLRRDVAALGVR